MKNRIARICAVALASTLLLVGHVDAARLGGGKSIGKQSSGVSQRQATPQQASPSQAQPAAPQPAPALQPQSSRSKWLGPLAGLAAGIGLAALASHFGFGEELASMMMIALLVVGVLVVVRLVMARRAQQQRPAFQAAGEGMRFDAPAPAQADSAGYRPSIVGAAPSTTALAPGQLNIPPGFDVEGFVRNGKVQFVRLQAAFDAGKLDDLHEFTTPEMFAELRMQILDRGATKNRTDVVRLDAELLGIETDAAIHLASLRFHGLIREHEGAAAEAFDEVWNLEKPVSGQSGWMLAGIQQLN